MSRTLNFQFEELPLVMEGGFAAGDVTGSAEIAYHRDGEWTIRGIALDGARRLSHSAHDIAMAARSGYPLPPFERRPVMLDEGDTLYLRIYHRLEHDWRDRVQDAVIEQLAADHESGPDTRADHRRRLQAG
ncbi:hypothetical protein [Bradyrhizobium prioriisuperbiae]|uniref:hypothetical protein n=1 Tax=Bradyrhizobium prioriisuperbiae TaxID=2854389 RepID=UPI0028EE8274|nr:hypothetical protein [Bradyrhizobium prioritasuperba]